MATLLTAALQEYPDKSVVLLIDDPYVPKNAKAREQLENARALPAKVERILAEPARRFAGGMTSLEIALRRGEIPGHTAMLAVASAYADAIQWLEDFAADQEIVDHTDTFFVNEILLKLAESFREVRTAVALGAARPGGAWRGPVGHLHAAVRQLPGLGAGQGVPHRRQGALRGPAVPGQVGQPGSLPGDRGV